MPSLHDVGEWLALVALPSFTFWANQRINSRKVTVSERDRRETRQLSREEQEEQRMMARIELIMNQWKQQLDWALKRAELADTRADEADQREQACEQRCEALETRMEAMEQEHREEATRHATRIAGLTREIVHLRTQVEGR